MPVNCGNLSCDSKKAWSDAVTPPETGPELLVSSGALGCRHTVTQVSRSLTGLDCGYSRAEYVIPHSTWLSFRVAPLLRVVARNPASRKPTVKDQTIMQNATSSRAWTGRCAGRTSPSHGQSHVWGRTVVNGRERPVNAMNTATHPVNSMTLVNTADGRDRHEGTAVGAKITDRAGVDQVRGERSRPSHLVVLACRVDRHGTGREATGEAAGARGVLPEGSLTVPPRVDLEKGGSGTPGRGYRQVPETPRNRGVRGDRAGSLPDTGGGGVHGD